VKSKRLSTVSFIILNNVDTRSIVEPAGALSVAGAKKYIAKNNITDKCIVAITSGANMNFDRLRFVAERAELGEHREALISAIIPEKPGRYFRMVGLNRQ
jgi:threonine dehydratase